MRIVLLGGSAVAVDAARLLLAQRHDVVIVERDKERIAAIAEVVDCGFLHGDGTRPAILREAVPADTDVLLCLSNHDQDNILASLVARSLGFRRVITKIEDIEYQHVCAELGLDETVVPDLNTARTLVELVAGEGGTELSAAIRGEARLFSFVVPADAAGPAARLDLPKDARLVLAYRDERPLFVTEDTELRADDEVVVVTHERNLDRLRERWVQG